MGMSTHITGFKPPDAKFDAMKSVWDSCKSAGIEPPEEVTKFFDYAPPDSAGVEVKVKTTEWNNDYASGFEVNLKELDPTITVIRFYNSW